MLVKSMVMKKITTIFSVAVMSLFVSTVNAQQAVGIKGGVNIASLSGFEGRSRVSAHGGVFLHHTINRTWCFQPELLFSGEGQRYIANTGEERTLALGYLQLPLMIQYYPVPQVYFEAGPQFGLLLSAQDKVEDESGDNINAKDDFTAAQVALGLGIGFKATEQLILYGRYNFGLTDVTRFDNIVDHSNVGQLGIAIRLKH
jgi:outer membrane immunogenic protein